MRLTDILNENNFRALLEEMVDPVTSRPPPAKGTDAIKVTGYFVHGHWRRHPPPRHKADLFNEPRRRRLKMVPR